MWCCWWWISLRSCSPRAGRVSGPGSRSCYARRWVVRQPARLAGIGVDEGLVARLVDDTDSGEALPLLAFTLAQLADGVVRSAPLSGARYDQLGGVQGALTRQADAALADASAVTGRRREEVIAGLLRLVTVDEQGRPTRWRVPREELPEPVTRELDAFVERRLMTTDTENGRVVVGVAHEAFLSAWEPLAQAVDAGVWLAQSHYRYRVNTTDGERWLRVVAEMSHWASGAFWTGNLDAHEISGVPKDIHATCTDLLDSPSGQVAQLAAPLHRHARTLIADL
jgi:hypothetical protein